MYFEYLINKDNTHLIKKCKKNITREELALRLICIDLLFEKIYLN